MGIWHNQKWSDCLTDVSNTHRQTVAAFGPTLRELWLDNCPRLTDAALTDSLPYCEALEVRGAT